MRSIPKHPKLPKDHSSLTPDFGALFHQLRKESGLTIESLAELTKISRDNLLYLENEEFSKLPPRVYVRGFIARSAKFLAPREPAIKERLLGMYAKLARESREAAYTLSKSSAAAERKSIGPEHIAFFFAAIFLAASGLFLLARFTPFLFAPRITVLNPASLNAIVNFSNIRIEGRASFVSLLTLNGEELYIGEKGLFAKEVALKEGVNRVELAGKSIFGRRAGVVRRVVYIKN